MRRLFVPVTKVDAQKRLVYGTAALEVEDKTGEIFDYDSSVPFFKEWSDEARDATKAAGLPISLGNLREMHGKSAAGKLTAIDFDDGNKRIEICGKVIDDKAWEKVQEGVYTGFSIGGDYVNRWNDQGKRRYTAKPSEISLVDNPAMPGAHFSMVKANGMEEEHSFAKYYQENEVANPTNRQVTERAEELAKSQGGTFAQHIEEARALLIKEMNPGGEAVVAVPKQVGNQLQPSGKATITDVNGSVQNNADDTQVEVGDEYARDGAVNKPSTPGNTDSIQTASAAGAGNSPTDPRLPVNMPVNAPTSPDVPVKGAGIDPRNGVVQGWQAKDGSFHISKAAAIAHNVKLDSPAGKLDEAIAKAKSAIDKAKADKADMNDSKKIDDEEKDKADKSAKNKDDNKPAWLKSAEKAGKASVAEMELQPDTSHANGPAKVGKAADASGDGSKPYGNTTYADPGYKADKKKRYPIDTEAHIRAAWSYIHKPKNHVGYTTAQVGSIKSKIVDAWKKVIGGEPPAADAKKFVVPQVQKGMHTVSRLACLIEELNWLQESSEAEAIWEKDGSAVPGQLKGDIASLVGTLKNMVDEETAELFDEDEGIMFAEVLEMAASSVPATQLRKYTAMLDGGMNKTHHHAAQFLKATMPKEHMGKVQEMHDHCAAMGAKCYDGAMGGKAAGDDSRLAKGMEVLSAENADLREQLGKAVTALTTMADDIQSIKNQPMVVPPTTLTIVDKSADGSVSGQGSPAANELLSKLSPDVLATAAIGLIHRSGGRAMGPNGR